MNACTYHDILNISFGCEFKRHMPALEKKNAFQHILIRAGVFGQYNVVFKIESVMWHFFLAKNENFC